MEGGFRRESEDLAELNHVSVRVQRVAHQSSMESPFFLFRVHGAPVCVRDGSDSCDASNEEDRLDSRGRAPHGSLRHLGGRGGAARDPVHDQLKSGRLQQDVVVVAIGLAETEHAGVERSDPIIRVSDGVHVWVRLYDDLADRRRIGEEISGNVARVLRLP